MYIANSENSSDIKLSSQNSLSPGTANVAGFSKELGLVGNQFNWISASLFYTGFVPGFLYYTTIWYPNESRMTRIAFFFSAGTFAGIFAGPIASALTKVKGSLKEYQYIFIFEGAITVVVAFISYFILRDYPEKAGFITEKELEVVNKVFKSDQIEVSANKYTLSEKLSTLLDIKLWCFGTIFAIGAIAGATQAIFGPTLISQLGYKNNSALVMSSIPSACVGVSVSCKFLFVSDPSINIILDDKQYFQRFLAEVSWQAPGGGVET
ncbi:putative tartrate transporter [Smittium culicis]|uniref:Putative tartrate transporter n=1 Tax=Smittium culicis TaxID=133412 RepID=A0A1R1YMN6_9FUNG|nr:putative tartrate transporter [Smittium culicis]